MSIVRAGTKRNENLGLALSRALPRGCGGLASPYLACEYGATALRELAFARAELLLQLGACGGHARDDDEADCDADADRDVEPAAAALRRSADALAAELHTAVTRPRPVDVVKYSNNAECKSLSCVRD